MKNFVVLSIVFSSTMVFAQTDFPQPSSPLAPSMNPSDSNPATNPPPQRGTRGRRPPENMNQPPNFNPPGMQTGQGNGLEASPRLGERQNSPNARGGSPSGRGDAGSRSAILREQEVEVGITEDMHNTIRLTILDRPGWSTEQEPGSLPDLLQALSNRTGLKIQPRYVSLEKLRSEVEAQSFDCHLGLGKSILSRVGRAGAWIESPPLLITRIMGYHLRQEGGRAPASAPRDITLRQMTQKRVVALVDDEDDLESVKKMIPSMRMFWNMEGAISELESGSSDYLLAPLPLTKKYSERLRHAPMISVVRHENRLVCYNTRRVRGYLKQMEAAIGSFRGSDELREILLKHYNTEQVRVLLSYQ